MNFFGVAVQGSANVYEKGDEVINGTVAAKNYCNTVYVSIEPYNASDQYVTYTVSDPKIARVEKLKRLRKKSKALTERKPFFPKLRSLLMHHAAPASHPKATKMLLRP